MSESAASVALEAKNLQRTLKELLTNKNKDPWDRNVDLQRKNVRRQLLALLLLHPYALESKDAETHLWMQTSYNIISVYKRRLAKLDAVPQASNNRQEQQQGKGKTSGPVEYRKLLHRFRQFLAEEEKFWTQLVARFRRSFGLNEVHAALVALEILPVLETTSDGPKDVRDRNNHFQFPPENEPSTTFYPQSEEQRKSRLLLVSKALICLGDIARYRELYNESGGRPKAGVENSKVLRTSHWKKKSAIVPLELLPRARNYDRAKQYYKQAHYLVPDEGNAFHQLAIVAAYQKDSFLSMGFYYRAICVRSAYDVANENLGSMLRKALDQWKKREPRSEPDELADQPRIRVDVYEDDTVLLHALWRLTSDRMDKLSPNHSKLVVDAFASLVSDVILSTDMITSAILLNQGALWTQCMYQSSKKRKEDVVIDVTIEPRIFASLIAHHRVLLDEGVKQVKESATIDSFDGDLAQKITVALRRMLPALRISSKWLRVNFHYIKLQTDDDQLIFLKPFWESFANFIRALSKAFPLPNLPKIQSLLEEDIEMKGFLPLKNLTVSIGSEKVPSSEVHPNEEQLMRIADLLKDARALANIPDSPLAIYGDQIVVKGLEAERTEIREMSRYPHLPSVDHNLEEKDDDAMTEGTSRTEDDPVRDAFNEALNSPDPGEEEIVWNPKSLPIPSPPRAVPVAVTPPSHPSPVTPIMHTHVPVVTTAQDLLNSVMGSGGSGGSARVPDLLFGSGNIHTLRPSIWSTSNDLTNWGIDRRSNGSTPHFLHSNNRQPTSHLVTNAPPSGRSLGMQASPHHYPSSSFSNNVVDHMPPMSYGVSNDIHHQRLSLAHNHYNPPTLNIQPAHQDQFSIPSNDHRHQSLGFHGRPASESLQNLTHYTQRMSLNNGSPGQLTSSATSFAPLSKPNGWG